MKPLVVMEASDLEAVDENRWEGSGGINFERSGSVKPIVEVDVEEGVGGWQGSGKANSGMASSIAIEFSYIRVFSSLMTILGIKSLGYKPRLLRVSPGFNV